MYSPTTWLKLIIAASLCLMVGYLTVFDIPITNWLWQEKPQAWVFFMDRSLLQKQQPGFNDSLVLIYILALCCRFIPTAVASTYIKAITWERLKLASAFLVVSGLWLGLFIVHIPKFIWARIRPAALVDLQLYTPWYRPGPPFSSLELSQVNSFPSGHTAMTLAFFSITLVLGLVVPRRLGIALSIGALLTTTMMGISRSAMGKHWITDWMFILIAGTLFIHWSFFKGLDIPSKWRGITPVSRFQGFGWQPWKKMLKLLAPVYVLMIAAKILSYS